MKQNSFLKTLMKRLYTTMQIDLINHIIEQDLFYDDIEQDLVSIFERDLDHYSDSYNDLDLDCSFSAFPID